MNTGAGRFFGSGQATFYIDDDFRAAIEATTCIVGSLCVYGHETVLCFRRESWPTEDKVYLDGDRVSEAEFSAAWHRWDVEKKWAEMQEGAR